MRAIVYHDYGPPDVLRYEEVERPSAGDGQVLVRVHAASVNALDSHLRSADVALVRLSGGLFRPRDPRLGADLAGRVEAVGRNVTQFRPGDEVFGVGVGAFAEYALARADAVVAKPPGLTFEAAAALPIAALTALQGLRDHGRIRAGQQVLIQGASGGVGTFAVQIAKAFGAEVTAVCGPRNLDLARSLGANHVIDYTREDFTRQGRRYDLILAVNGYHPLLACRRVLSPTGTYVLVGASSARLVRAILQAKLLGPLLSRSGGRTMDFMGIARINRRDLSYLAELHAAGTIAAVIDRRYPLAEAVEAFRYVEGSHGRGKVVLTVEPGSRG